MQKFLCIGHRGAKGLEPENTLRSVSKAVELGADGVEIDVYLAGDQLVVIHDETLDRTTNGNGHVMEKSFDYLRSLDAGKGERIPILREVFEAVDRRAFINIELKGPHTAGPVLKLIEEYLRERQWKNEDFLVSSFDLLELRKLENSGIRLGMLFKDAPAGCAHLAKWIGAWAIHIPLQSAIGSIVEDAHANGLKVFVYTVNSGADIGRMRDIGVDGVFTDYPDRAASFR